MHRDMREQPDKDIREAIYEVTEQSGEERSTEVDAMKLRAMMHDIKENQNLPMGILGGIGGAAVGAIVWGFVSALTGYQIGFMAIGVGFLTGISVRKLGRGVDKVFGLVGALLSLAGCLAGNLLMVCIVISRNESVPLLDLMSRLDPQICTELMGATFSAIDLLFYGIAIYQGYRFSFRRFSPDELSSLVKA